MAPAQPRERDGDPTPGQSNAVALLRGSGAERPLDLHEGLCGDQAQSQPRKPTRCERWPSKLRLASSDGTLVTGRCKAANQCDYCAVIAAVEAAEMLALDGMTNAPTTLVVLTTRTATIDTEGFYNGRREFIRALRAEVGPVEYASLVEFTTGYGEKAGGLRRPHWNLMLKGVVDEHHDRVREIVRETWCEYVDAEPWAQHVGPVYAMGGLTRYLALHFLKASQMPPRGFRGQRFNCSRGYFGSLSRAEAREAARASLRWKREVWKQLQEGVSGEAAELMARLELEHQAEQEWALAVVDVHHDTGEVIRVREVEVEP